ncbi:MAG: substrate-binding domain-containing protein [Sulfolobales archaeon]
MNVNSRDIHMPMRSWRSSQGLSRMSMIRIISVIVVLVLVLSITLAYLYMRNLSSGEHSISTPINTTTEINMTRSYNLLVYSAPVFSKFLEHVIPIFKNWSAEKGYAIEIQVVYGGTGSLINRVMISRQGDVMLFADSDFAKRALDLGLIYRDTIRPLGWQVIAVLVPLDNPGNVTSVYDLVKPGLRVAISDPETTPAGNVSIEILKKLGLYDSLKDRLIILPDQSYVARQLSLKAVDAGLGWNSFYYWYPGSLKIIWLKQEDLLYSACQVAAVLNTTSNPEIARMFVDFLADYLRSNREWAVENGFIIDAYTLRRITPYTSIPSDKAGMCGGIG